MVHFTVTLPYSGVSEYRGAAWDQFILTLKKKKIKKRKNKKAKEGEQNWYLTKHLDSFKDKENSRFITEPPSPNQTGFVTQSG